MTNCRGSTRTTGSRPLGKRSIDTIDTNGTRFTQVASRHQQRDGRTGRPAGLGLARPCLDWTERFHHLGGPLGIRFLDLLCERKWLRRDARSRAVHVTALGRRELTDLLGVDGHLWQ